MPGSRDSLDDTDEVILLLLAVQTLHSQFNELVDSYESLLVSHIREQRRLNESLPVEKKRLSWNQFTSSMSDRHFRRMFRMEEPVFNNLCSLVCAQIGEDVFCPEAHLSEKKGGDESDVRRTAGEVKMGISIRMLANGSYLDLIPLFVVSSSHSHNVFTEFLAWIASAFELPLAAWLRQRQWTALEALANSFAEKSSGVFHGPFGALDGLAVRTRSPTNAPDPGNHCCRKGFCALSVQAICDGAKRFLWVCPSNKGGTHDSAAFSASRLVNSLTETSTELEERGSFIVGDSAHGQTPCLLVPCDQADMKVDVNQAKDSFNFHLSSCGIHIECAFGELVMRWGTLWRTLLFDLKKGSRIVQVCMLPQNCIIENREDGVADGAYFANFQVDMSDPLQQEITQQTGEVPRALASDNNEPRNAGRRTTQEHELIAAGNGIGGRLTTRLAVNERRHPTLHDMECNSCGHVHMNS